MLGFGSGFDLFRLPIAVDQLRDVTHTQSDAGHNDATIGAIIGQNVINLSLRELPQGCRDQSCVL